jgi:S-adenosylmethionine hydrolase
MKGVLLSLATGAQLVDIAHDIAAQDIDAARLAVARYWRRFPAGTVHLVVVDPGVGTSRLALAVASGGQYLVGPDNGVLSPALFARDAEVIALDTPAQASSTFHGRDVFAPAAARLANGVTLTELGVPVDSAERRRTPEAIRDADGTIRGEIITIDRFGNATSNIVARGGGTVAVAGLELRVVRTYSDGEAGEAVALAGSIGFLEIAVRNGNAAEMLRLERGQDVVHTRHDAQRNSA